MMESLINYGENVSAISAIVHQNPEAYKSAYEKNADDIGWSAGIWSLCADAGKIFTQTEAQYIAWEDFYRIEAIEEFAQQILSSLVLGEVPGAKQIHKFASDAIINCFIK